MNSPNHLSRPAEETQDPSVTTVPSLCPAFPSARNWEASGSSDGRLQFAFASTAMVLTIFGSFSLMPLWLHLIRLWSTDSLRIIGAAFPAISLVGVLVAWRRMGWSANGSLWGLPMVALSIQLARFVNVTPYFDAFQAQYWWEIHPGPVFFLYGVGTTLLFGGWLLLRAAILPLCLLLFVNPVPLSFNRLLDMPLQQFSASTARAFAHLIGLNPTGVQLRMMFAPDFGMMIVPGCNGIRGSITLAYLAAIWGYTRRLRLRTLAMVSLAGLLCGYAMNLVRLCVLVIYYRIGLSIPSIQSYGTQVDYVIGCTVFLVGTGFLGYLIRSQRSMADVDLRVSGTTWARPAWNIYAIVGVVCFLLLTLIPTVRARALLATAPWKLVDPQIVLQSLPMSVGAYTLVRTYSEQQYSSGSGPTFVLGDYTRPAGVDGVSDRITLGLYTASGYHRVIDSKLIQGSKPEWTGSIDASPTTSTSAAFGVSVYDDGETRQFNAETNCTKKACRNPLLDYRSFRASDYIGDATGKHLPIVLRMEWPDSDPATTLELRKKFESNAREFIRELDFPTLVSKAGTTLD